MFYFDHVVLNHLFKLEFSKYYICCIELLFQHMLFSAVDWTTAITALSFTHFPENWKIKLFVFPVKQVFSSVLR